MSNKLKDRMKLGMGKGMAVAAHDEAGRKAALEKKFANANAITGAQDNGEGQGAPELEASPTKGKSKVTPAKKPQAKAVSKNFSILSADLDCLDSLSRRALSLNAGDIKAVVQHSYMMRVALKALENADDAAFRAAVEATEVIKTGRPT